MNTRSALARARNHGAAGSGVEHWWANKITSVLLIPLVVWLLLALGHLAGGDFETTRAWLARPWNTTLALLLTGTMFYHIQLGIQTVIEDYVHSEWLQVALLIALRIGALALFVLGSVAILRIAFGVAPLAAAGG